MTKPDKYIGNEYHVTFYTSYDVIDETLPSDDCVLMLAECAGIDGDRLQALKEALQEDTYAAFCGYRDLG